MRLVLLSVLLLISLLTLFTAPAYYLWLLAVMVGEYGLLFIGSTLIILASGWLTKSKYNALGTFIGILALALLMLPIIEAFTIAQKLPNQMQRELKLKTLNDEKPFSFLRLFVKDPKSTPKTLNYVTYPDTSLTLDYYAAETSAKRPCVIVVHGGSWSSGDSKQLPELNTILAAKGYQVASINYRLAPKWHNPAPVEDVRLALSYLTSHANELHIDTSQFVLLGRSAGAQIALLAAYTLKNPGIKGVVNFYGPADMVWGYSLPAPKLVMDSRGVMENYLGGTYNQVPQNYKTSSPVEYVDLESVPTLTIHGANDALVAYEHSCRLNNKLQENGISHFWLKLPWATHGFDHHLNGPGGQLSTYAVLNFLNNVVPVEHMHQHY